MSDGEQFLGVPEPVVLAIGKMVVAAGRVEFCATLIAHQLGVPSANGLTMDGLRKESKAKLNTAGVPEGSAVTATEIKSWMAEAAAVYLRRSGIVHGVFMQQWSGEDWDQLRFHPRPNEYRPVSESEIEAITAELVRLQSTGFDLVGRLPRALHQPPPE